MPGEQFLLRSLEPGQDPDGPRSGPHEARHSYITNLRAEEVDDADLAETVGQTVATMITFYTHPLGRSEELVRCLIG